MASDEHCDVCGADAEEVEELTNCDTEGCENLVCDGCREISDFCQEHDEDEGEEEEE